ncbi:unnamed protein product, partial [Iphiclides podalirius]
MTYERKHKHPPLQDAPKKTKKDDRSKKDDKNVEQFMKSLNSVPSFEEKLSIVSKKYVQMMEDNKRLQFYIKQSEKRFALTLKEKEHLQHEFNKTVLVKSKLENLCRELQKQNKAIKEESLLKIREEEERCKETQAKFQSTLSEITNLLQQNNEKNAKLRDDNISMTEKFKSVMQQYQLREQQVDKMAKQMALESELSEAKLQKASLEHQAEKERLIAEMEQVKVTLAQYRAKLMEMQTNETSLKGQLAVYTDKYDEFQTALVKSNQVFGGFKEQMEKMSKKIQKLEKESLSWKKRWETSQTALLDMCGERQATEERASATNRQLHHMQSLCRTLQAERTLLLNTLKEHNIERPPLPAPAPAPAPPAPASASASAPASNAKVDAMAANCAQLRQSLAHLQTQLNVLTNKNGAKEETAPKEEVKQKKTKTKKSKAEKQAQKIAAEKSEQPKELESDGSSAAKEITDETEPSVTENTVENVITVTADKEIENLVEAVNSTDLNAPDLEVVNGEVSNDKEPLPSINDNDEKEDTNSTVENEVKADEGSSHKEVLQKDDSISEADSCEEIAQMEEFKPIPNVKA